MEKILREIDELDIFHNPRKHSLFLQSGLSVSWKVTRLILCPRGDERLHWAELNSVDAANDQHRMAKTKLHPGTETNSSCSELSGCCQMALMMNQRRNDQTKKI